MSYENPNEEIGDGSFIFSRHTKRSDGISGLGAQEGDVASTEYPHITEEGVEKARKAAREEFAPMVENSTERSVLFIGGSSEEDRTKETAEVIGNELAQQYAGNLKVKVFTRKNIDVLREQARQDNDSVLNDLQKIIDENPDKKLVFAYPLFLNELSLRPQFRDRKTGKHTEFSDSILSKTGIDESTGVKEWFAVATDTETTRSTQKTAEVQLEAINRLQKFAKKFVGDRPLLVGMVGHGWQLDALALYLANKGKVSAKDFEKLFHSEFIQQAETGKLSVTKDGAVFTYKGKEYSVPADIY